MTLPTLFQCHTLGHATSHFPPALWPHLYPRGGVAAQGTRLPSTTGDTRGMVAHPHTRMARTPVLHPHQTVSG